VLVDEVDVKRTNRTTSPEHNFKKENTWLEKIRRRWKKGQNEAKAGPDCPLLRGLGSLPEAKTVIRFSLAQENIERGEKKVSQGVGSHRPAE